MNAAWRTALGGTTTLLAAAAFGFAIGASKNLLYAWRSAIKVPLLLLGTAAICAATYLLTAALLGVPLRLRALVSAAGSVFIALARLLGALAPAVWFLGQTMTPPSGPDLGGYPLFVGTGIALIACAGAIAVVHQTRTLQRELGIDRNRARWTTLAWLLVTLAVGGQFAFWLRPFFGIASLTGEPPFLLGSEPTVTGARNFYEVVWQFVRGVTLPR
ncbi:MAG: hypothetical protein IPK26_08550 [Planctomycetes bacterium]|nr:hypothetical protein [Planctomycetota bacterium]